jgi:hypothetical protein
MARKTKAQLEAEALAAAAANEEEDGEEAGSGNPELDALMAAAAEEGDAVGEDDDDELDIDLSEAEDFSPFKAKVPVEIVGTKVKVANDSKNKYIELKLRVFEGDYEGRILWRNLPLKGKGSGFTRDILTAFGAGIDWDAPKIVPSALLGLQAYTQAAPDKREEYKHKVVTGTFSAYTGGSVDLPD